MDRRRMIHRGWALALAFAALALPDWAGARTTKHSGTVLALDRTASVIVLAEIGPWRVRGGATVITRRTILVTPRTEFTQVKRVSRVGATGWIGDFAEVPLNAWEVRQGDFVTAEVRYEDQRLTALKVTVVALGER